MVDQVTDCDDCEVAREVEDEHIGLDALRAVGPALDDLYAASGAPVTARTRWQEVWSRTAPGWEPWIITVRAADGSLAGAAPMARRRVGPLLRVVGLGHGTADDARLPVRTAAAAPTLATAMSRKLDDLGRPWTLLVEQLPADCPVSAALVGTLRHARLVGGQGMPMVETQGDREPNHFLSRNARGAENKARNRLATTGVTVTERWLTDPTEVRAAVPAMSAVHRARDRQLGRVSDHEDPSRAAFYRDVLIEHAAAGELEVLLLEADGDLAAYVAAFRDGAALRVWDNRVSPRWAEFSAGRLANHAAIRRVLADPDLNILDWMRGEEPYKLSSATKVVATQMLEAWSSPVARAPYAAKDALRVARERSRWLDRTVRRARLKAGKYGKRLTGHGQ
jgi:hypothetical protein